MESLHAGSCMRLSNILEVEVVFLYGLEAVESQVVVGLGEGTLVLWTKQMYTKHMYTYTITAGGTGQYFYSVVEEVFRTFT